VERTRPAEVEGRLSQEERQPHSKEDQDLREYRIVLKTERCAKEDGPDKEAGGE
jgi:hypothetical protein